MVMVACETEIKLAFVALLSLIKKVSSGSSTLSPLIVTLIEVVVVPGGNVSVPEVAT